LFILKFLNFSKSLKFLFGLLVLLIYLFSFKSFAFYLSLNNNNLHCNENDCSISINKNQKINISVEDPRVVVLTKGNDNTKEERKNYLFYTTDIVDTLAYSGKPLEILISLSSSGLIEDLRLIKHSEPILMTGIPVEKLLEAIAFYKGKNIKDKINIGENFNESVSVPIIVGATVTSLILHRTILESAREVGAKFNIIDKQDVSKRILNNKYSKFSWDYLIKIGAIQHYCLDFNFNEVKKIDENDLLIDIYFADLRHPSIGRNILGDRSYFEYLKNLKEDESFIIILTSLDFAWRRLSEVFLLF